MPNRHQKGSLPEKVNEENRLTQADLVRLTQADLVRLTQADLVRQNGGDGDC